MRSTRLRSSRRSLLPILMLIAAVVFWPAVDRVQQQESSAQGVSWLSDSSVSYLTSSGIPVMVPSWLPSQVAGVTPEIYAGGGSYSIYFYGSGGSFLYITGVAGGGFPGGSEANLNVQLSINASVMGYPAIQDIGIPEGSTTQIYDKVMWIADGVFYTVNGNGLDSGSLSLANSSTVLYAPAPPQVEQPPVVTAPPTTSGTVDETNRGSTTQSQTTSNQTTSGSSSVPEGSSNTSGSQTTGASETPAAVRRGGDGTGGPWYTGNGVYEAPSDGTSGAVPPFMADDGTGGAP